MNEPVVVESLTTENQLVEALPDGTSRVTIDSVPARTQIDNEWVPVDPTLEQAGPEEFWSPAATTVPVRFYGDETDTLAEVQMPDGSWLTEKWPLGPLPEPVIDGPHATYADVLPDVDLRLTATATGMSEVLIIHTEEAAADPDVQDLSIQIEGAALSTDAHGTVTATPEGDEPAESDLRSNSPIMWDSTVEGSNADGPHPSTIAVGLETEDVPDEIDLGLDALAETEDLNYPVYVDPDWTGGRLYAWYIDELYPNQSYPEGGAYTDPNMMVGYIHSSIAYPDYQTHRARSFWWMDTSAVVGKQILGAAFNTTEVWAASCSPRSVQLWRVSNANGGASWNGSTGVSWDQHLSDANVAYGYNSSCPVNTVGFDAKAALEWSAANNQSSIVLAMRAADENDMYSWKRFSFGVQLIVTYNTRPQAPYSHSILSPKRSCGSSGDPEWISSEIPWTFRSRLWDADGGNLYPLLYLERKVGSSWSNVLDDAHLIGPAMVGGFHQMTLSPGDDILNLSPGAGHSYVIDGSRYLVEGVYRWTMRSWDGYANSPYPSQYCYIRVENDPPATPTVSPPPPGLTIGQPVEITVQANFEEDQPAMYQYYWEPNGIELDPVDPPTDVRGCDRHGAGSSRFACARGTGPVLLTVAPTSELGTLQVRTVDEAHNVSPWFSRTFSASPDYTSISTTAGHTWMLDTFTNPIADANTTATRPLSLGAAANTNPLATAVLGTEHAVIEPTDTIPISVFKNIDGTYLDVVGTTPGRGTELLHTAGWVYKPNGTATALTGQRTLCKSGTHSSLTLAPVGGSCAVGSPLGYVGATSGDVPSPVQLRVCSGGTPVVYYVKSAACGSDTQVELLGWGMSYDAVAKTALPVIDTSESFSVSAYLQADASARPGQEQTALSQASGANSGFRLGINEDGGWQFCMSDQRPGSSEVCATGTDPAGTEWTLVTGVWDKTNEQLRLYLNQDDNPTWISWRAPATFEDGISSGGFTVANAQRREAPAERWFGAISGPAIFPGVIDVGQRFSLMFEEPLPTGP
ncbi:hypothetical protein HDC94_002514 [Leifsonia sp. AK011]|uniref:LamG-like jellyroll fold domain-containing protein n=1 Tax=Leifsonia sp. AK011 TaxID=2723075 RepID=UPI0015CE9B56|nr:LamG-like jellyroll fold domain-containing protein [Leifsonia sp. AK011]NYF11358.1 hypothetical protein [Leifsonia sp. AK011]